jgi:hypothetical protein
MDNERELVIDDVLGGIQARLSLEGTVLEQRASELKTVSIRMMFSLTGWFQRLRPLGQTGARHAV